MSEHTPGPWTVDHFVAYITAQDQDDNVFVVAEISKDLLAGEPLANAELIAKAPEMAEELAALQAVAEAARKYVNSYKDNEWLYGDHELDSIHVNNMITAQTKAFKALAAALNAAESGEG